MEVYAIRLVCFWPKYSNIVVMLIIKSFIVLQYKYIDPVI